MTEISMLAEPAYSGAQPAARLAALVAIARCLLAEPTYSGTQLTARLAALVAIARCLRARVCNAL